MDPDRFAVDGAALKPPPGSLHSRDIGCVVARPVAKILVEGAEVTQSLEQDFLVLLRHCVVERALPDGLGEKLGRAAVEIGLDLADALRLAAECVRGVQIALWLSWMKGSSATPNLRQ